MWKATFTTAGIRAVEQMESWQASVSESVAPIAFTSGTEDFLAEIATISLGPIHLAKMTCSSPYLAERTSSLIRQCDPECYIVGFLNSGHACLEQDNRQASLHSGDVALFDLSRPSLNWAMPIHGQPFEVCFAYIPHKLLPLRRGEIKRLNAVTIGGDAGMCVPVARFLSSLVDYADRYHPIDVARISIIVMDAISSVLRSQLDSDAAVVFEPYRSKQLARIMSHVSDNLTGDLRPESVARANNVSVRHLHRLFHDQGMTLGTWVRELRLKGCRHDLMDPFLASDDLRTIGDRWGFGGPSQFSLAFKTAFGITPRDFRKLASSHTLRLGCGGNAKVSLVTDVGSHGQVFGTDR